MESGVGVEEETTEKGKDESEGGYGEDDEESQCRYFVVISYHWRRNDRQDEFLDGISRILFQSGKEQLQFHHSTLEYGVGRSTPACIHER